jgi:hypothetical protein
MILAQNSKLNGTTTTKSLLPPIEEKLTQCIVRHGISEMLRQNEMNTRQEKEEEEGTGCCFIKASGTKRSML